MVGSATAFACYDGMRVAVTLHGQCMQRVVIGTAVYERDRRLGPVLRVLLDSEYAEPGFYDLLLVESEWNGAILPDTQFGCDRCFMPRPFWERR
jgi:hypothetical protein